jgi:hypothetical protein
MLNALFLSLLPLLAGDRKEPDLVVLENDKEVECRVLFEGEEEVVYRAKKKEHRAKRAEVKEIHSLERSLREFLDRYEKVSLTDIGALSELALFAEESFLPGEARNMWIRILLLDGENEQAWTKLGGVKGRKGWRLQVRGRFYDLEELRTRVSDWKNAMELSTAHFLLRTDADPLRALNASIDVERAYQVFYEIVGRPLKLFIFDEEPEIHIYADSKNYPNPPNQGQRVWFSPGENTLQVDGSANPSPGEIVAEFTQCMLFNSFRRSADTKTGEMEPWARQGLMSAFAVAVRPDPGRVKFEFEPPHRPWFRQVANDREALGLARILTAGRASFDAGTDAERYHLGAYTLVHFLAFHQDGKYRQGFATFLQDSFLGKGGKAQFLDTVGAKEAELEAEWKEYVKETAAGA